MPNEQSHPAIGETTDTSVQIQLLRSMIRIRAVEDRIQTLYSEQEMRCPTHLCTGQEAPPAGVSSVLRPQDLAFSNHRSHGHYVAKGGDIGAMFAELYGRADGCAGGKGGSQHLVDLACGFMGSAPILASTISVGVGAAWAAKLDRRDEITVVYFGDGATEEGAFHESLNYAAVMQLPVLFVCENNLYSVHSDMSVRQPQNRPIAALGPAHGMPGRTVDGNDVEAIRKAAAQAAQRAIRGDGPTLLECMTYRWFEHCGPGDDIVLGYRSQSELDTWRARDPIEILRARLGAALDDARLAQIRAEIEQEIDASVAFARASPYPSEAELSSDIFPTPQGHRGDS